MKERVLDIVGICEARMTGNGRNTANEDYVLLHSGPDKKQHGIALRSIVTQEVGDKISDVKYVNERMMGLTTKVGNS